MAKVILKSLILSVAFVLFCSGMGYSQSNARVLYKDIIGSDYHFAYLNSVSPPSILLAPDAGVFKVKQTPEASNLYSYNYAPGISKGNTKVVLEYYRLNEATGEVVPDYTTIHFRITPSLITCNDDFFSVEKNSGAITLDVLANDTRTNGPLLLEEVTYSEHGSVNTVDGKIVFVADEDFVGDAFLYYSVVDALGEYASGMAKVKVVDQEQVANKLALEYISYGGEAVEIDLPYDGFVLESVLSHGTFKSNFGKQQYIPNSNFSTSETFQLRKGGITREVTVRVVAKEIDNSFVVDDVRYTSKGSGILIDVLDNDLKPNGSITAHSSGLETTGEEGVFAYSPPSYYSGSKKMTYSLSDGHRTERGMVTVHVNNFNPQHRYEYDFLTLGNSPLVVNYNIPLSDFSFEIVEAPGNGEAFVNDGFSMIEFDCDEIEGNNLIIYNPDHNFIGKDEFSVRYCVDGKCKTTRIKVEVVEDNGASCRCYTGCVWSGDANNDGVVNASDMLTLAYAFGEHGAESVVDAELPWNGRKAADWNFQSKSGVNAKYADSDGNGIVDEADFEAIAENYNQNHALVPPQFLERRDFPFTLTLEDDTVYIGDLISFDIGLGNDLFPALDVNGISYSLGFPSTFVDSASLSVDYLSDSWFGIDESIKSVNMQVRKGWLESGAARLSVSSASGVGAVARASFIVEEDVVGGFRVKKDGIIPMIINASDIQVGTSDGKISTLDDAQTIVYLDTRKRSSEEENSPLKVYPNPASDILNVHMNGGHDILSYEIFNVSGQRVFSSGQRDAFRSEVIPVAGMNQGVYILKAQTTSGLRIHRFEVIR